MAQDDPQKPAASESISTPPTSQAMIPYPYASDEIDLVEVGVSLWRRWKLILVVFLVCLGLAILLAFLLPKKFTYSATVEVGTQIVGNQVRPVEPPDSAAKKVENGFIPELIQSYAHQHGLDPRHLKFNASSPQKTNLVVISGKTSRSMGDAFKSIEKAAAQRLIQSELSLTNVARAKLESKLADERAKLQELQSPKYKTLLREEISSLTIFKKQAQEQQLASSRDAHSTNDAMSALLLGSQVIKAEKRLSDLQQKLEVALPGQISSTKAKIASVKAEIYNLQASKLVAGPLRSVEPAGLSRRIIAIIGALIGIILAFLAGGAANYISAVRNRLRKLQTEAKI